MAFANNAYDLPDAKSFTGAMRVYESIKPLRNSRDLRPLGRRSGNNAKTVSMGGDGEVIFTLHATDVVTWFPDGSCKFVPFESRSTVAFANTFLPGTCYAESDCNFLVLNHSSGEIRTYATDGCTVTIKPCGRALACPSGSHQPIGTKLIKSRTVNRKAANALYREYQLEEFMLFARAMDAMSAPRKKQRSYSVPTGNARTAIEHIRTGTREDWVRLVRDEIALTGGELKSALRSAVREANADKAYDYHTATHMENVQQIRHARASMESKFGAWL